MTIAKPSIRVALAFLLSLALAYVSNAFALPAAGVSIVNVATTSYLDSNNEAVLLISNPAFVVVGQGPAVDLERDQFFPATPSQSVYYSHRLTNIGNIRDSYSLSISQESGDSGDLEDIRIYLDVNENGLPDAGEPEITQTSELLVNASISLVVAARVPFNAQNGATYSIRLQATSNTNNTVFDANIDGVGITDDAVLVLNKTSSKQCETPLLPGDELSYRIGFTSVGQQAPPARVIRIDGIDASGVLIEDQLPDVISLKANTPVVAPSQGQFLVQRDAELGTDNWLSFAAWNGVDAVERIAVLYPGDKLKTNDSGSFSFVATINDNASPGVFYNAASIDLDADGQTDFSSNSVCNTVASAVQFSFVTDVSLRLNRSDLTRSIVFAHTLRNDGVISDAYHFEVTPSITDSGDLTSVDIYLDNGDGVFDATSDTLYAGQALTLAAGVSRQVFVRGDLAGGFAADDTLSQTIRVTSSTDSSLSTSRTETINFRPDGAFLRLQKATSRACTGHSDGSFTADRLKPNERFTYSINFENIGDAAPAAQNFTVDGAIKTGVMLYDRIPYGLMLEPGQSFSGLPSGAQVVVRRHQDRVANLWLSYTNWNGSDVIGTFGVLYPVDQIGVDAIGNVSFDVRVVPTATASARFFNTAYFDYNSDGVADAVSNQVCNLVQDGDEPDAVVPQANIRFLAPTLDLILSRTPPSQSDDSQFVDTTLYRLDTDIIGYAPKTDGVFIEVGSSTLREGDDYIVLDDGRRQVVVDVESVGTGDTAKVVLRETFAGSGIYRSIRPLVLSDETPNGGGICPPDQTSDIDYAAEVIPECRLLSQMDDDLIVSITDTGINKKLEDDALVDPLGIVFDANTLQPVAGATVVVCTHLPAGENSDPNFDDGIDDDQCGPFGEIAIDPFSPTREPLPIQTTGADGFYQYAFLFVGDYFIDINPPAKYAWPSAADVNAFIGKPAAGRSRPLQVLEPSYGRNGSDGVVDSGVFTLNVIQPILVVDLPVDPVLIDLSVTSNCDASGRVAGDVGPLSYSVAFSNGGNLAPPERIISVDGIAAKGVLFESRLPFETTPIAGSVPVVSPAGIALLQTYSDLGSDNWTAFNSWDGISPIAQVGVLVAATDVEPGEGGSIDLDVDVTGSLTDGTVLTNVISVDVDNDGINEAETQAACNVSGPNAEIRFIAPSTDLRAAGTAPAFDNDANFVDISFYTMTESLSGYRPSTDGVYIELNSTAIPDDKYIVRSSGQRQVVVDVESGLTGDSLEVILLETFEGSGLYRSVRPVVLSQLQTGNGNTCPEEALPNPDFVVNPGPACILQSAPDDKLKVSFLDKLGVHEDDAVVDPLGVVFDSQSLQPIAGATVSIRNLDGSLPIHPFNGTPLQPQVTGADGAYHYPFMFPGTYYLQVIPPPEYTFPSVLPPEAFDASGFDVIQASYGQNGYEGIARSGEFTLTAVNDLLVVDFPLDNFGPAQLIITKEASVKEVELGGLVEYTITLKNNGEAPITDIVLDDKLPYGFKFVSKTARLDAIRVADPAGAPGPKLSFILGNILKDQEVTVSYYLQATAGAVDSDGINTAVANGRSGTNAVASNVARAKVSLLRKGVLSDKAYLFGKVYVDSDCNNIQTEGEWPIGAVKVYMEDGTYAITDENGQYSLYGLEPGLHVVKVDPLTLPKGLTLKPIDNRHAADGDSRFADLVSGDYHRADFAAACPPDDMVEAIKAKITQRNQKINANWMLDEAERFDPTKKSTVRSGRAAANANGEISSGLIGSQQTFNGVNGGVGIQAAKQSPISTTVFNVADDLVYGATSKQIDTDEAMPLTEEVVKTVTEEQAKSGTFLWPEGDTSLYGRFMVTVRTGVQPVLFLNGTQVSDDQLGEQFINKREHAQVLAWYGLQLTPGPNLVEVKGMDPFGNLRVLASKEFHNPGLAESIKIDLAETTLPADGGRSAAEVTISLLDAFGKPARGVHFVTVEVTDGLWVEPDIQDQNPGYQTRVQNGVQTLHLRSSEYTGEVIIKASVDTFETQTSLHFIASNRSLVAVGLGEAGYQLGSSSDDGYGPSDQNEGFDQSQLDTRAALFLKGRIKGDMHLTLSYDTDKDSDADLLRDINPNEYYPIPGDNSVRGFEAQSRSKLYAKLEKERHSLLWGDYVTDLNSSFRDLSRVQRTLTGVRGVYDNGRLRGLVFGAKEEDSHQELEIPANGTAMLYRIPNAPIVRNSEVVELVTRDRDAQALIVATESLQRFVDYTIDDLSGDIRFTRAIPTLDENLNPIYIRIAYSVDGDGREHNVVGARAEFDVNNKLTVGASYTADEHPTDGSEITGGFANFKPTDSTNVLVSVATMSHEDTSLDSGDAMMVELKQQWQNGSNTTAMFGQADAGFTNSGAGISADNREVRVNHTQKLTNKLDVRAEYLDSQKLSVVDERQSLSIVADYRLQEWTLRGGSRRNQTNNNGVDDTAQTLIVGAGRGFSLFGRGGNINTEYEYETGDQNRKRLAADASWQAFEKAKVYGRYEQVDSLTGSSGLNSSQRQNSASLGVETDWLPSTTIYNEYRMRGVTDGRDLEAATGVRGDYEIVPGLKVSPTLEVIDTMDGTTDNSSTAVSFGLADSRDKNARKLMRVEARFDNTRKYYGFDGTYVARVNLNWSSFFREDLRITENDNNTNELNHVFTVGFAHRPRLENRYHALWLYQHKLDRAATDREVHLFSTHQNLQLSDDWIVSGRAGIKWEQFDLMGTDFDTSVAVIDGRLIWDITRRIDLDLHGGVLATNGVDELRYSLGFGANFLLNRNLRLNAGYNLAGFIEKDLDGEAYNAQGPYIGLQIKFDEKAFDWLAYDPTAALETATESEKQQ